MIRFNVRDPDFDEAIVPEASEPNCRQAWTKRDGLAILATSVVGLLLAIAPHLATLAIRGSLDYLADGDDVLYLTIARAPYYGEGNVRDPFARRSEAMPTIYSWAQFVPFTLPSRWLGLSPLRISLVWRVIGGVILGVSLFILFRRLLVETKDPTAWALGLSLICLSDAGFVSGRTLVENLFLLTHLGEGTTPFHKPDSLGQYRVVTPLLNLPFLFLMIAALVPSSSRWRARAILGSVCLGLCFHLYFFYWTAAVPALVASALSGLILGFRDPARRAIEWANMRTLTLVLVGGMALGLPQVYANARTFSNPEVRPILERMGRGRILEANDPVRTRYLGNSWAWGKLVLGGAAIAWFRLRGLGLVWWLTFFGFAMANSALVTGLEFENFHWTYVHAPMGEILILAITARLLDKYNPGRMLRNRLLWVVPCTLLALASAWRPYETLRAPDSKLFAVILGEFRGLEPILAQLGPDQLMAGPPEASVAILFARCGLLYQEPQTYLSSVLPDESVHERHALSAWVEGLDLRGDSGRVRLNGVYSDGYRARNKELPFLVVPSGHTSRWSSEVASIRREELFAAIDREDGGEILRKYRPDVLLWPYFGRDPDPTRGGPWRLLGRNAWWSIWVLNPVRSAQEKIDSTKASASKG